MYSTINKKFCSCRVATLHALSGCVSQLPCHLLLRDAMLAWYMPKSASYFVCWSSCEVFWWVHLFVFVSVCFCVSVCLRGYLWKQTCDLYQVISFLYVAYGRGSVFPAPTKTAENTVKHCDGGVGSMVANHHNGAESSVVVTTLLYGVVCTSEPQCAVTVILQWWQLHLSVKLGEFDNMRRKCVISVYSQKSNMTIMTDDNFGKSHSRVLMGQFWVLIENQHGPSTCSCGLQPWVASGSKLHWNTLVRPRSNIWIRSLVELLAVGGDSLPS